MSTRARRRQRERPAAGSAPRPEPNPPTGGPERSLLNAIAAGELDSHLPALAQAIDARVSLLHTVRSIDALAELCVGDHVRINQRARPRYLHGIHGTIIDLDDHSATVCIHRPVGRFNSREIRCPPLAIDKLAAGI